MFDSSQTGLLLVYDFDVIQIMVMLVAVIDSLINYLSTKCKQDNYYKYLMCIRFERREFRPFLLLYH